MCYIFIWVRRYKILRVEPKPLHKSCYNMLLLSTYDKSRTWAKHLLYNIRETLARLGLTEASNGIYDKWIYLIIVIVASLAIMFLLRIMMRYILQRITQYRKAAFIQELIDTNLIAHALWLIPFTGVQLMLPYAFGTSSIFAVYFQRICSIFIVLPALYTPELGETTFNSFKFGTFVSAIIVFPV